MKKIKDFINENEWETFIRENEHKWSKWDDDNKRYLIMGLCGDWYYKDKFLQDRGYDPVEVKELFQGITKERNNILKGVLEDQDKIIP